MTDKDSPEPIFSSWSFFAPWLLIIGLPCALMGAGMVALIVWWFL